jgi:hypothetical protein
MDLIVSWQLNFELAPVIDGLCAIPELAVLFKDKVSKHLIEEWGFLSS